MKYTIIENTNIRVSRIAFGTGSLHHLFSSANRQSLLEAAFDNGITHFDTSPYYGYGLAETDLGKFLRGRRNGFTVATKVGLYPWGTASTNAATVWARKALGKVLPIVSLPVINCSVANARNSLYQSLKRLKTDYVDFVFLHEPDMALINTDEFLRWFETESVKGTVRSWGLAGLAKNVAPWVQSNHLLARVIQTQDSLDRKQADFMLYGGRSLQFNYGYMSSQIEAGQTMNPSMIIGLALTRNTKGAVIVSSRRPDHIASLVEVVG